MKLLRVCALGLVAAALTACASGDTDGEILTPDPVGGLRFVNAVSDTGALDFRIVDVVENAPIQVGATFRTGGSVNGVATTFMPPYQATLAGTRHVRVFLNSLDPAVAARVVYDTTVTVQQGLNYTFYLYGTARTGSSPGLHSLVTNDVPQTIPSTTTAITQSTMVAITTTTNTIVAAGGSWTTQGVKVGDMVVIANHATTANNGRRLGVTGVTASTITVAGTPLTANAVPDSSFSVTIQARFGIRVIDLASSKAGTAGLASNVVDVFADTLGAAVAPLAGTADFTAVNYFEQRPYALRHVNSGLNYRVAVTATGTTTPFIQADVPNGQIGTSTINPIAGDLVAGTGITALIVPRSVAGSTAPQTTAFQSPTILFLIDQQPPRTAP